MLLTHRPNKIYFLRPVGSNGPIKIGCSSWPEKRLPQYMKWSPVPLEIIGVIDGSKTLEGRIHKHLWRDRLHHEWFDATPSVLEAVHQILAGTFDWSALPEKGVSYKRRAARREQA